MCQAVVRGLYNPSKSCPVQKVAHLLAQAKGERQLNLTPSQASPLPQTRMGFRENTPKSQPMRFR
jgi:hypothetical protein